jgi:carboxypeptidase D
MVGFDVPHVTNDMILRFMDVDVSLVAGNTASSKSRVGDDERVYLGLISSLAGAGTPLLKGGNTDWECKLPLIFDYTGLMSVAWYNAGSAILILLILCSIVGLYFYFRRRRPMHHKRGVVGLPSDHGDEAERVPLGSERVEMDDLEDRERRQRKGKGKGRMSDEERGETVFSLGDEDEDDDVKDRR